MDVKEATIGPYPCLVAGEGAPLVVLSGLSPDAGVSPGPTRWMHAGTLRPWARTRRVFYLNRRAGLPPWGISTGGSIAQQLAARITPVWLTDLFSSAGDLGDMVTTIDGGGTSR